MGTAHGGRRPAEKADHKEEAERMDERKTYRVLITETRQKAVAVEARSEQEARRRAEDAWKNAECLLGEEDFQGVEFYIVGEGVGERKRVERLEPKDVEKGGGHGDA